VKELLSIGKLRGLQQCSTPRRVFSILALDHRNNLRNALNPEQPQSVSYAEMVAFKCQVTGILSGAASAVLLDPELGLAPCIASAAVPGRVGLIAAVEATGYAGEGPTARISRLLEGWSVSKARKMGASAVKLLVYYHPRAATAPLVEELVQQIAADCRQQDIPLILEPLSYSLELDRKLSSPEKCQVVLKTAQRLTGFGGDLLKAEFPLDIKAEPDEGAWADACARLTESSRIPWVLLSASVGYEDFLRQLTVACRNGASGAAVGRAVWKEATSLRGPEQKEFLEQVALVRLQRITALCEALARPFDQYYSPVQLDEEFYRNYS